MQLDEADVGPVDAVKEPHPEVTDDFPRSLAAAQECFVTFCVVEVDYLVSKVTLQCTECTV